MDHLKAYIVSINNKISNNVQYLYSIKYAV